VKISDSHAWPGADPFARTCRHRGAARYQGRPLAKYVQTVLVNRAAEIISWLPDGWPFSVMGFAVWNGKIVKIDVLRNPGRLSQLDLTVVKE
jgi:hypothetical protein